MLIVVQFRFFMQKKSGLKKHCAAKKFLQGTRHMLFLIFENLRFGKPFWQVPFWRATLAGCHVFTTLTRTTACSVPADVVKVIVSVVVDSVAPDPAVPPAIVHLTPVAASIVIAFPCWS